ncbi:type 1 glutamine amidotransferase domain-containing protein [Teredinibacter waterburyi]|uniref:type 1 glutamine amidotransferase domain-containing protein n=1 Tax=Teredinibacter waterburyi TaxID=1500538 RepID=UPI00165FB4C4|nr:type 1 glutamine amidotransferase domain-containing protein [Teredinibacter waterburyi]
MLKKTLIVLSSLLGIFFMFIFSVIIISGSSNDENLANTKPEDIAYLEKPASGRGKILAVVTSTGEIGNTGMETGYELTELSRAYYVFHTNGFEVDIASPNGGRPPVVIDEDDIGKYDYAFMNDIAAQKKVNNSIPLNEVIPGEYKAVYFVGGKGAMYDFPNNSSIQKIIREYNKEGKVISAICHGPSAFVNVMLSDGTPFIANKNVSAFTNNEELFLIPNAKEVFPFLLQDKLTEQGALFEEGSLYLEHLSQSGSVLTGQNPWSIWPLADAIVKELGYSPRKRAKTPEEHSIDILLTLDAEGLDEAKALTLEAIEISPQAIKKQLITTHALIATLNMEFKKMGQLIYLLFFAAAAT